jgi:hypothetical protein
MQASPADLVRRRFMEVHGATVRPAYGELLQVQDSDGARGALGYRRAAGEVLFLERYLDAPVETILSAALGQPVARRDVIEIGNLAAADPFAMISLWGMAANDLGSDCDFAVATLTAPLRAMFARLGITLHVLARAGIERADQPRIWGRYYETDPMVCAGRIAQGQQAIAAFLARRRRMAA